MPVSVWSWRQLALVGAGPWSWLFALWSQVLVLYSKLSPKEAQYKRSVVILAKINYTA